MLSRSDSLIMTLSPNNIYQHYYQYNTVSRRSEPEIFTFEQLPDDAPRSRWASGRSRRRNTRVMYPAQVRRYLPPPERCAAKRWLLLLVLVVCAQVYSEDAAAEDGEQPLPFSPYRLLPFRSAELQGQQMKQAETPVPQKAAPPRPGILNNTCPSPDEPPAGQSPRNCYVVALLYPVYHSLGSES